jgi:hypothetical protein
MRRHAFLSLLALAALGPASAAAQGTGPATPTGLVGTLSFAGGGELGLEHGEKPGVVEIEASLGWEIEALGLRPEVGAVFGIAPDGHAALRPGLRWTLPGLPIQLRAALDASNARDRSFRWRWLLLGVAGEVRLTGLLGLFVEVDTGAPIDSDAGLPLLARGGASIRF